ncbi:MAG TPA: zf-HC2 domain-containing protein [Steroidobacteraceae bacterium]|nr:zf-HC2 domain-containing protein [Steroidobacteraceae bacterium]
MEHLRFKSEQTAAAYVAGGLDPTMQEQFELHLMSCPDCVEEVESWRALKGCLPLEAAQSQGGRAGVSRRPPAPAVRPVSVLPTAKAATAQPTAPSPSPVISAAAAPAAGSSRAVRWRVAAALAAGVIVGAAGGWYGRAQQGPSVRSESIGFYSLPPLMRGPSDCTAVRVGPQVTVLALRVPGVAKEQRLVAVDSEGHDLASQDYSVATQADGSWLVRLRAEMVRDQGIRFEARSADGTVEPRGCVLAGSQS